MNSIPSSRLAPFGSDWKRSDGRATDCIGQLLPAGPTRRIDLSTTLSSITVELVIRIGHLPQ
jgi:hypothetical protein